MKINWKLLIVPLLFVILVGFAVGKDVIMWDRLSRTINITENLTFQQYISCTLKTDANREVICGTDNTGGGGNSGIWGVDQIYLWNNSGTITLNETKLNLTIDLRDDIGAEVNLLNSSNITCVGSPQVCSYNGTIGVGSSFNPTPLDVANHTELNQVNSSENIYRLTPHTNNSLIIPNSAYYWEYTPIRSLTINKTTTGEPISMNKSLVPLSLHDAYLNNNTLYLNSGSLLINTTANTGVTFQITPGDLSGFFVKRANGTTLRIGGTFGPTIVSSSTWYPLADNTYDLGSPYYRWKNGYFVNVFRGGLAGSETIAIDAEAGTYMGTGHANFSTLYAKNITTSNISQQKVIFKGATGSSYISNYSVASAEGFSFFGNNTPLIDLIYHNSGSSIFQTASNNLQIKAQGANKYLLLAAGTQTGGDIYLDLGDEILIRDSDLSSQVRIRISSENGSIAPNNDTMSDLGGLNKRWNNVYAVTLWGALGDLVFTEKEDYKTGEKFKEGDILGLYVKNVTEQGTVTVPVKLDCECKK